VSAPAQHLNAGKLFVKRTVRFNKPENAPLPEYRNSQRRRVSHFDQKFSAPAFGTPLPGVIVKNPKVPFRQVVAADPPVHKKLIDVTVR